MNYREVARRDLPILVFARNAVRFCTNLCAIAHLQQSEADQKRKMADGDSVHLTCWSLYGSH